MATNAEAGSKLRLVRLLFVVHYFHYYQYQCILRGNGAQPFNGSREIVTALVPGAVRNWAMKQGAPNIIIE